MGLGAFIAGVMVADSEYRHQLEADVMPFNELLMIVGLTAIIMDAKSLVIYPLA